MTNALYLGIWMDHARAHLTEFKTHRMETITLESDFSAEERGTSLGKSEQLMHNKEQHQQAAYYKKLGDVIKQYKAVLLFGPTSAKAELMTILKADRHFAGIRLEVKSADKMTENQQHAFVKTYFTTFLK